jgi:transcriptional regulator GlxA family with amidase domain
MPEPRPFVIVIPIYQGVDLMDMAAPYEIFNWMAEKWAERKVEVHLVAERTERPVFTRDRLQLTPRETFEDIPRADLLWVPGGNSSDLRREMGNPVFLDFLRRVSKDAEWVTSVCEGSFLLAEAGLLDGHEATSHWAFLPCYAGYPKIRVAEGHPRYVKCGNRVTGGGISSGLDEALGLVLLIAGEEVAKDIQLTIQYYPCPPVEGSIPGTTTCPLDTP